MKQTIMIEGSFALDTNVLIYLESLDIPKRHIAEKLLSYNPVISPQVISEFINVTHRLRNVSKMQIIVEVSRLFRYCPIASISHLTFDKAAHLMERYDFQIFDSIIIASALEADCNTLYSEDMQHNMLIDKKLRIINPFLLSNDC